MSEQLDTVALVREFRERQRERGRFDYQRVAFDSAMAVALVGVTWFAVKLGLGIHEVSKIAQDPDGAAQDAARGIEIGQLRNQIRMLEGPVRPGDRVQSKVGREAALVALRRRLAELEGVQASVDEVDVSPGIKELRGLDRFMTRWIPVAPVGIAGANIFMEVLRIRRLRSGFA